MFLAHVARAKRVLDRALDALAKREDDRWRYEGYPLVAGAAQFINIGAGKFFHPRWTNVDYGTDWYSKDQSAAFINYNLLNCSPLPFSDGQIELAYTSHTIEHVPDAAVENLFRETHRVLKPGGVFRVTCPDADLLYWSTRLGRREFWSWRNIWFERRGAAPADLPIEDYLIREISTQRSRWSNSPGEKLTAEDVRALLASKDKEEVFRTMTASCGFLDENPGNHINWWNFNKCKRLLEIAGFDVIFRSAYGASIALPLQNTAHFDNSSPNMSLYLEAVKS
jgi:SAM-dependent methyltransferase